MIRPSNFCAIGATALLVHTGWQLCRGSLRQSRPAARALWLLVMIVGAGLALSGAVNPAWIVLGGGAAGVYLFRWAAGSAG